MSKKQPCQWPPISTVTSVSLLHLQISPKGYLWSQQVVCHIDHQGEYGGTKGSCLRYASTDVYKLCYSIMYDSLFSVIQKDNDPVDDIGIYACCLKFIRDNVIIERC